MRVREDDATILLSRADNGLFDIIVMSKEFSENYKAEYGLYDNTEIIRISTTVSEDVNEEESEGGGA